MESKAFTKAKEILNKKNSVSLIKEQKKLSMDKFLHLLEKCEGKKNGNNGSK